MAAQRISCNYCVWQSGRDAQISAVCGALDPDLKHRNWLFESRDLSSRNGKCVRVAEKGWLASFQSEFPASEGITDIRTPMPIVFENPQGIPKSLGSGNRAS